LLKATCFDNYIYIQTGIYIMKRLLAIFIRMFLLSILFFIVGCTVKPGNIIQTAKMPELIHKRPPSNFFRNARVGLFTFSSPEYAPGVGEAAANAVYKVLAEKKVFEKIYPEIGPHYLPYEEKIDIAQKMGLDLIIIGRVNYWIDGSLMQKSQVNQDIKVIQVDTREEVWYAEAVEIGEPFRQKDLIFVEIKGQRAPSPMALMSKNAEKFSKMMLWSSKDYKAPSKNKKMVDVGYKNIIEKKYDQAIYYFREALKLNPDNPLALFYIALAHESQGNYQKAIYNYQKVVQLNPNLKVQKDGDPGKSGYSLVQWAKDNVSRLQSLQ
jgi:tetratricopeptide (TPR) repeat protein